VKALGAECTLLNIVGTRPLFSSGFEIATRTGFSSREDAVDYLRGVAGRYEDKLPNPAISVVESVEPALTIGQLVEIGDYDLVAMATHGRSGLTRLLLGSVAEKVVRRTHSPVMLYRPRSVRLPSDHLEEAFRIYGD
jgi:nucleotide-binding universal stress UspA family protein